MDDAVFEQGVQASPVMTRDIERALVVFLAPLLVWLDVRLNKRLVRTLVIGVMALLEWRNRARGLLLSELGAYILDPAHAPAGTKRLSNLLRSPRWGGTRPGDVFVVASGRASAGVGERRRGTTGRVG